jgi:hypothetical protein
MSVNASTVMHVHPIESDPSSPLPLSSFASTLSSISTDLIYLFGGWSGSDTVSGLHSFNLVSKKWTFLSAASTGPRPSARCGAALTSFFSESDRSEILVLFGGVSATFQVLDDMYYYVVNSREWRHISTPSNWPYALHSPSSCMLSDSVMLLVGLENGMEATKHWYFICGMLPNANGRLR